MTKKRFWEIPDKPGYEYVGSSQWRDMEIDVYSDRKEKQPYRYVATNDRRSNWRSPYDDIRPCDFVEWFMHEFDENRAYKENLMLEVD